MSECAIGRDRRYAPWDYSNGASLFITIATEPRRALFGKIKDGKVALSKLGEVVASSLLAIPPSPDGRAVPGQCGTPPIPSPALMAGHSPARPGRFIIAASSVSKPGTMGGNTKIAIELARCLPAFGYKVVIIVPESKKATFTANLSHFDNIEIIETPDFNPGEMRRPISSLIHYTRELGAAFARLEVSKEDIVFATCNFHFDIIPLVLLESRYRFRYMATHFLFSPNPAENLVRRYGFPFFKYAIVWLYERSLLLIAKAFAEAFVVTNECDFTHFRARSRSRLFAFYGGVNVEQIPLCSSEKKTRDVVFCSRLHPQKGVSGLLDIWKHVVDVLPNARISIIGNGEAKYERMLKAKAESLGIAKNLEWLGYVNNEAKYNIYSTARIFAHSTVFDNNGMVAAEALCTGLPVVMYDIPDLRRVYDCGCVKADYGDKRAFAAAIVNLLTDEEYYRRIAPDAKSVARLRERWNWNSRVAEFVRWMEGLNG